jgi:hypothetical protein
MWLWAEAIACYSLCTGAAEARVEARADVAGARERLCTGLSLRVFVDCICKTQTTRVDVKQINLRPFTAFPDTSKMVVPGRPGSPEPVHPHATVQSE